MFASRKYRIFWFAKTFGLKFLTYTNVFAYVRIYLSLVFVIIGQGCKHLGKCEFEAFRDLLRVTVAITLKTHYIKYTYARADDAWVAVANLRITIDQLYFF